MTVESIFEVEEFKALALPWQQRRNELKRRAGYYDGSVYGTFRKALPLGAAAPRMYKGVKALYLPLARAVVVDAGIIPGGWALASPAKPAWAQALRQVLAWSDWATDGVLYVHYGAQYGVSGLKVADLREARRVVMKPVDPTCFLLAGHGDYDATPRMALWIDRRRDADGAEYEYAEVVTAEQIRTFKNGAPAGFDGRAAEYPNELGFVPFREVQHINIGRALGEATYQMAIPLLDEVNELASYLADIIRKHAEAQWAVAGAEPSDLVKSGDNVWFLPSGSEVKAVVASIDVAGVLAFIQEIRDQVYGALPELAFQELVSKTQIATATVELQLMELVIKVRRCRPNYDHGYCDGLRMVGRAAESLGLRELATLNDEALTLDAERPVLPLDKETQMRLGRD